MCSYSFTTLHHLKVKVVVLTTFTFTKCIIPILQGRKLKFRRIKLLAPVHTVSGSVCQNLPLDTMKFRSEKAEPNYPARRKHSVTQCPCVRSQVSFSSYKLALTLGPNPPAASLPVTQSLVCTTLSSALGKGAASERTSPGTAPYASPHSPGPQAG